MSLRLALSLYLLMLVPEKSGFAWQFTNRGIPPTFSVLVVKRAQYPVHPLLHDDMCNALPELAVLADRIQ